MRAVAANWPHNELIQGEAMQRIHLVGRKNSGKTTLIREIVGYLTSRGLRVGTIKHTHHHHELDLPGKDSYLHREAGAEIVGIITANMQAVFWNQQRDQEDSDPYKRILTFYEECDLVIVEGDLQTQAIKVEVWRPENHPLPLACERSDIAVVICDNQQAIDLPSLSRSDIPQICEYLLRLASVTQIQN